MLTLNLVSEQQKKEIKLRHIYRFIKIVNLILIVMAVATAIVLLAARLILQSNFVEIVAQTTLVTKNNQGYNTKVREINNKLNFVGKIQDDFIIWSDLLIKLADNTPADIKFYYLKLSADGQTVKIKGRAGYRDSFLAFKARLEQIPAFSNIEFPIKNLLEKENLDFEINAALNLAKMKAQP